MNKTEKPSSKRARADYIKKTIVGNSIPPMGSVWSLDGRNVVVLGNCTQSDGSIWTTDIETGICYFPMRRDLNQSDVVLTYPEICLLCVDWASRGNENAILWLGYFYIHGSLDVEPNDPAGVAFSLGYLRLTDMRGVYYSDVIFQDCVSIVREHLDNCEEKSGSTMLNLVNQLDEFKDFLADGYVYVPSSNNPWRECVDLGIELLSNY